MRLDHESKSFNLLRNKYVVKVIRSANLLALLQKKTGQGRVQKTFKH